MTMTHPLDGARLKVVRAQEHLDCLKAEIRRYLDKQTNEVSSQPHMSPHHPWLGPTQVLPNLVINEPEPRLSAIIGDCVTNSRAAIDYVMWELAQRYFVPAFNIDRGKDRELAAFPMCEVAADFQDCSKILTKRQVPTEAITEVNRAQPYNTGYQPLLWLQELVNRDKHRMLLLTIGEVDNFQIEFGPSAVLGFRAETVTLSRTDLTAIGTTAFQSDMQMKGKATIYVTWKDVPMPREPADRTLEQIIKCVADIIPRFDRFFA